MDSFLEMHGGSPILKPGTDQSINFGKLVVDTKWNNIPNVVTPYCRIAACSLDRPRPAPALAGQPPGREKFFARLLFNPKGVSELTAAIMLLAQARWQPITVNGQSISVEQRFGLPVQQGGIHFPLTFGDHKYNQDPIKNIDYQGVMVLNTTMEKETKSGTPLRPVVLDRNGQPADPNLIFPGCYVRATIKLASYEHPTGGPGITAYINSVQFVAPGPRMKSGFDAVGAAQGLASEMGAVPDFGLVTPPGGVPQQYPPQPNGGYPAQPPQPNGGYPQQPQQHPPQQPQQYPPQQPQQYQPQQPQQAWAPPPQQPQQAWAPPPQQPQGGFAPPLARGGVPQQGQPQQPAALPPGYYPPPH